MVLLSPVKSESDIEFDEYTKAVLGQLDFVPTGIEQKRVLSSEYREIAVSGGEQSGKSTMADKMLQLKIPFDNIKVEDEFKNSGRTDGLIYWLVAEDYGRTRKEFEYVCDSFTKMGYKYKASSVVNPGEIVVDTGDPTRKIRISTKSGQDPRTLAMEAPHGIIVCEAGQLGFETYMRIRSRLGPRKAWLFMSGTMESSLGWWPQLIGLWESGSNDQKSFKVPSYSNTYIYPGGVDDPEMLRLREGTSDDFFRERIEGVPVPPKGLVFPEFRADIHVRDDISWEPSYETVHLWEDPGYGSSVHAVIAAQVVNRQSPGGETYQQVQVFDEVYEQGMVQSDIIDILTTKEWWNTSKIDLVSDPHYKDQHHSMDSVSEQWLRQVRIRPGGKRVRIKEGTERLKSFLKLDPLVSQPRFVVSSKCTGILSEFGVVPHPLDGPKKDTTAAYRWKIDKDGNVVGQVPHDQNNDAIKACIYGLIWKFGYTLSEGGYKITMRRS